MLLQILFLEPIFQDFEIKPNQTYLAGAIYFPLSPVCLNNQKCILNIFQLYKGQLVYLPIHLFMGGGSRESQMMMNSILDLGLFLTSSSIGAIVC